MKNRNLRASFNNPKFRHGGYAALITALLLSVLVVVNILVGRIPATIDLTRQKLFSLSEQTGKILKQLERPLTIYGLFEAGKEPEYVDEILKRYAAASPQVRLVYVDPFRNPGFLNRYRGGQSPPGENSIIVEMEDKFRVISQFDLFHYSAPSEENPLSVRPAQSMRAEQTLTGAILYVSGGETPVVYQLRGHQEEEVPYELLQQLATENYTFHDLDIVATGGIPEDADLLLVISPRNDLSDQEESSLREYLLERGGNALFLMDLLPPEQSTPRFDGILRSYGVQLRRVLVIERDPGFHLPQLQIGLIPDIQIHSITTDLITGELAVLFPRSQAITELEAKRRSVVVQPLLQSSAQAWGKTDLQDSSMEPAAGDPAGPFIVAVAVSDETPSSGSRIVVAASSFFLYPERAIGIPLKGPGNADLFSNAVNWLYGREETISIRAKSLLEFPLRMNQLQFFVFAGISVFLLPLSVLIVGLVIWLRRRHL